MSVRPGRPRGAFWRNLLRLSGTVAVALAAMAMIAWVERASDAMPGPAGRLVYLAVIGLALLGYAVLLAIPYVPGVELGITILAMQGAAAAPAVYLATVLGLGIAYAAGRICPPGWLVGTLDDLRLSRAAALVTRTAAMTEAERLEALSARLSGAVGRRILAGRYLGIALLINLPGSAILGGGGGIMVMAGLSGLFRPAPLLLTIALAVAPVPLMVWLIDYHP